VIFAVTIVIWALAYYPRSEERVAAEIAARRTALSHDPAALAEFNTTENLEHLTASLHQRHSFLGRAGQWIEPIVRPLGWDWRIGAAAIASFPAGPDIDLGADEEQDRLQDQLRAARWDDSGEPVYSLPVALSIMVFFALCAQCAATLAVIRRETNSWRWPAFTFVYMTALAYVGALLTYQIGSRLV
jgi:ferrous iron transport protein B